MCGIAYSDALESGISPAAADEVSDESRYVESINRVRADAGLAPLTVHDELTGESRRWAEQLRTNDRLSHADDLSVGVTANWTKLGENVGVGPSDQLNEIFEAFVASPAHYANLMDPDFRFVGVGVVYDDEGRMWTTHRFMAVAPDQDVVAAESTTRQPEQELVPETLAFADSPTDGAEPNPDTTEVETGSAPEVVLLTDLFDQLARGGF